MTLMMQIAAILMIVGIAILFIAGAWQATIPEMAWVTTLFFLALIIGLPISNFFLRFWFPNGF